ncbi:MAG TPA: hypothetical protein VIM65_02290 [Cyclobacteriaceae bacterium]
MEKLKIFELNHKFNVTDNIKNMLDKEDFILLKEVGIPTKILSNTFVYYESLIVEGDCLVLGFNNHVPAWTLKISLVDKSVFYSGKGDFSEHVYCFYNTSLSKLLLSILSYEFFMCRLINSNFIGNYHEYHERYAILLNDLISDIDIEATKQGAWFSLISEMKLGVI